MQQKMFRLSALAYAMMLNIIACVAMPLWAASEDDGQLLSLNFLSANFLNKKRPLLIEKDAILSLHFSDTHLHPYSYVIKKGVGTLQTRRRLAQATITPLFIQSYDFDDKKAYPRQKLAVTIDNFFSVIEEREMHEFIERVAYPKQVFSNPASRARGEKPVLSIDPSVSEKIFTGDMAFMKRIHELFSLLSDEHEIAISTQAKICTLDKVEGSAIASCKDTFPSNAVTEMTAENSQLGVHRDYDPFRGMPVLFKKFGRAPRALASSAQELSATYYPSQFVNGQAGAPYLFSLLIYLASPEFDPSESKLGTDLLEIDWAASQRQGKPVMQARAIEPLHGRILIFDGSIDHRISQGLANAGKRVSLVVKMLARDRTAAERSLETVFMKSFLGTGSVPGAAPEPSEAIPAAQEACPEVDQPLLSDAPPPSLGLGL